MQLEIRVEELSQHCNVEKVPTYAVVLRNWVPELHTLVVRRSIDALIIEQVGKILVQEIHQFLGFKLCELRRDYFSGYAPQPNRPLECLLVSDFEWL